MAAVVDADVSSPVPWAATERPLGPDLAESVRTHGPLPTSALHTLALCTAQGLASLHAAQRSHGSLAPEGVLLAHDRALLADPGLIPWNGVRHPERSVFDPSEGGGTPAGDVFAWAAILRFAAGEAPGANGPGRVPLQLRGVVEACLRENPDLRPSSTDLVGMLGGTSAATAWEPGPAAVIERSAALMRGVLPAEPAAPDPRGRGKFLALTSGALALAVLAVTGAFWGYDRLTSQEEDASGSGSARTEEVDQGCPDHSGFPRPSEPITDLDAMQVEFSPDGNLLAISSFNHGLTLWDWREGEEFARPVAELNGLGPMGFAPVGCVIAATSLRETEGQEHPYRLTTTYDLHSGETTEHPGAQPSPHPDGTQEYWSVTDLAFSPDGRWMALSNRVGFQGEEAPVEVIDLASGDTISTLGSGSVPELAFLDENRLAIRTRDTIEIRDPESGESLQTIHDVTEDHFAVVPEEDQILFVRNGRLVLHDLDGDTEVATFPIDTYADEPDAAINNLGVDPELGMVHFGWTLWDEEPDLDDLGTDRGSETHGYLWDIETGENLLAEDDGFMSRPVAFHPEAIAAIDQEGNVGLVDPGTLEIMDVIE